MVSSFFNSDICFCMNQCADEICERNKCHIPAGEIVTVSYLEGTNCCPHTEQTLTNNP